MGLLFYIENRLRGKMFILFRKGSQIQYVLATIPEFFEVILMKGLKHFY